MGQRQHHGRFAVSVTLFQEAIAVRRRAVWYGSLGALALLDLNMLLCFGARERTADEYRALLEEAGFAEVAIHPTDSAQNERACHEGQSSIEKVPTSNLVAALRCI